MTTYSNIIVVTHRYTRSEFQYGLSVPCMIRNKAVVQHFGDNKLPIATYKINKNYSGIPMALMLEHNCNTGAQ